MQQTSSGEAHPRLVLRSTPLPQKERKKETSRVYVAAKQKKTSTTATTKYKRASEQSSLAHKLIHWVLGYTCVTKDF